MKRKLLSALLIAVSIIMIAPAVSADPRVKLKYEISDEEVTITGCSASGRVTGGAGIAIPDTIDGYPVTAIADKAFYEIGYLTSINIPESVRYIGESAFYDCKALSRINIPEGVKEIKDETFYNCESISSLVIPNSVTKIGAGAFRFCRSLETVTLPENLTHIGWRAFQNCKKLAYCNIPDGVNFIEDLAFNGCESLTSLNIPDNLTEITDSCFDGCKSLTSLEIPDGITKIDSAAFSGCSGVTSVTIPKSVTFINGLAFYGCTKLEKVYYKGSQALWDKILIEKENECLLNAQKLFAHAVTYTGDYFAIQEVEYGKSAVPPQPPAGCTYVFTVGETLWSGKNITDDVTVTVTALSVEKTLRRTGAQLNGSTLSCEFQIESPRTFPAVLVLALYDNNGGLVSIKFENIKTSEGINTVSLNAETKNSAVFCKAFLLESMNSLKPLSNTVSGSIQSLL